MRHGDDDLDDDAVARDGAPTTVVAPMNQASPVESCPQAGAEPIGRGVRRRQAALFGESGGGMHRDEP